MAELMLREAILQTLFSEMERDENVVVLGEDIVGGMGTDGGPEAIGGIWEPLLVFMTSLVEIASSTRQFPKVRLLVLQADSV